MISPRDLVQKSVPAEEGLTLGGKSYSLLI
jgi:hypothetical protein